MKVQFGDFECVTAWGRYVNNGQICLRLVDAEDGSPIATATVAIGDDQTVDILKRQMKVDIGYDAQSLVFIKDYSENEGIALALLKANVIKLPIAELPNGLIMVCDLTDEALSEMIAENG